MKTNNYFLNIFLTMLLCCVGTKAYAYDIAVANADGVTIYYNYINDGTELEVTHKNNLGYTGIVNIPESVKYMNVTRSVTSIGDYAFNGSSGLISVTIPNGVTSIGTSAFHACYDLTLVTIPNSVTTIGGYAFYNCNSLTSITIPNSVTSIGEVAFYGCKSLTSVTIPDGVTLIDYNTFHGCSGLTSVTIPNSVTKINTLAFHSCSGLTSITIPNSVTTIGGYAFQYCTGLTSITIPNSVTSIGSAAFAGCTGMNSVISKMENPCTISSNCFTDDVFLNSTLYVPQGKTDKYKSTYFWHKFKFIEEGDPSGIAQTPANAVLIQANDGFISISGLDESKQIAIYQTDGKQVATAKAYNGSASVATNISKGNTVIVKIGEKAVKVMMR